MERLNEVNPFLSSHRKAPSADPTRVPSPPHLVHKQPREDEQGEADEGIRKAFPYLLRQLGAKGIGASRGKHEEEEKEHLREEKRLASPSELRSVRQFLHQLVGVQLLIPGDTSRIFIA